MPVEDDYTRLVNNVVAVDVTRNGLGARGIDVIEKTTASGTVTAFPVYDGHVNMVATLARSGTGFAVNDRRSYDACGAVRTGNATGDPKGRYVANLGHMQDDESGLVYMRARYYEPTTGRFVSEDPARDGTNWFVYCRNNPISLADADGRSAYEDITLALGIISFFLGAMLMGVGFSYSSMGLSNLHDLMRDYQRAARDFGGSLPSDLMDQFMQRELLTQDLRIQGKLNRVAAKGFMSAGTALIGYSLLVQAFLYDTDLAFRGSSYSVLDYFEF